MLPRWSRAVPTRASLSPQPTPTKVQMLLRVPNIRLMDFTPEAEAYVNRFPSLSKVVLRQGAVEFNPLIPTDDITLLATSVTLVARPDVHPVILSLLAYAAVNNPKPGFDKNGDPVLFYRAGEFPSINDPEFDVPMEAKLVYKSGELPNLIRVLSTRAPFSVTAFVHTNWARLLVLVPLLLLLVPLLRALPNLYMWRLRRRVLYWYHQIRVLDTSLESANSPAELTAKLALIDRIDVGVRRIRLPLDFAEHIDDLREYLQSLRQRLEAVQGQARIPAERNPTEG